MDGNNRWSKKNLNKYNGYKKGANKLIKLSKLYFS